MFSPSGHEKYRPKDLRNLMVLAYFGRLQSLHGPLKDISELQPYELPWDAVAVHVCNGAVDNRQVMYQLNASVVALCIADDRTVSFGVTIFYLILLFGLTFDDQIFSAKMHEQILVVCLFSSM